MIKEDIANFDTTNIKLKLGTNTYSFWKSASIHFAIGEFCREATFEVSDNDNGNTSNLLMDSPIVVLCDDLTVLTGYIDDVGISYGATAHSITIKARSKTCDLVDCSYVGDTQFNEESARRIIERICQPFGIRVIWRTADWKIGELNINVGDTCASIITEICKRGAVFFTDDEFGNLVITDLKNDVSVATLFNPPNDDGSNLLSGNVHFSSRDRFSEYTVNSQDTAMEGDESADNAYGHSGTVRDPGVKRYRPKIITAETSQDSNADINSAEQEYMAATANAAEFNYSINGWKTATGQIWFAGAFVNIDDQMAHIKNKMIAKSCDLNISTTSGRITSLKLCYPNAMIKNYVQKTRTRDPWYYSGKEV